MSELGDMVRKYLRQQRALIEYIRELQNEAKIEVAHKGSPVTSMREDAEINNMGQEKLKIVKRLLDALRTE